MRTFLLSILLLSLFAASCQKNKTVEPDTNEFAFIGDYIEMQLIPTDFPVFMPDVELKAGDFITYKITREGNEINVEAIDAGHNEPKASYRVDDCVDANGKKWDECKKFKLNKIGKIKLGVWLGEVGKDCNCTVIRSENISGKDWNVYFEYC